MNTARPPTLASTDDIKAHLQAASHDWRQPLPSHGASPGAAKHATHLRCTAVDEALLALWHVLKMPASMALVAVGGYGRGELFPFSDVDVLVLLEAQPTNTDTEKLQELCSAGWDIGLELGHSVRTPSQCLEEAAGDITIETTLTEMRFLCGNRAIFDTVHTQFKSQLNPERFFQKKRFEQQQRHAKHQDTPYALEPNCKESPGGLRDLQVIAWMTNAAGLGHSWADMARHGLLTTTEAARLRSNERFLKTLRYQLHTLAKRREDRLVFDLQTPLAESLGFSATAGKRASEHLMQRYYVAAKSVLLLCTLLLQNLETRIGQSSNAQPTRTVRMLDDDFQECDGLLELRDDRLFEHTPSAMLRLFLVMQNNPQLTGLSAGTLRRLWHSRVHINKKFRNNPENKRMFIAFFQQPRGIVHELRRMNETGVLGRYLPVFKNIVGQMQHDLFHVYTVDQHILMVVRNLRRFTLPEHAHEYPFCSQLMANFERPWVLYLAALFHDVAKGRGGDHSELGEVDARRFCKDHELSTEDTDLIAFLVRHHLTLSTFAQKKDLSDWDVIQEFAAVVNNKRYLTALYLLTVADIRGTSPKVWNAWKAKLLEDLYRHTLKALGGQAPTGRQHLADQQAEAQRLMRLDTLANDAHTALWQELDVSYFLRQEPSSIAWHTRHLHWRINTPEAVVKARWSPIGEGIEMLVYTRDESDLFARICSYFDSKNLNILDAKIHTTHHGYALDSFVIGHDKNDSYAREALNFLEAGLKERLNARAPLAEPVFGRTSRQSKHFPVKPTVELKPDERGKHHVLSISATDRTGLLYSMAWVLARFKISVQTAKILTLGGRAEDIFLIQGQALHSPSLQVQMEAELLTWLGRA